MGSESCDRLSEDRAVEMRLDSWKEIAGYLGKNVRTVQRWEQEEHLPVFRHVHLSRSTVYAFRADLDRWLLEKRSEADKSPGNTEFSLRKWALAGSLVVFLLLSISVWGFWEDLHFLHLEVLKGRPTSVLLTTYMGHEVHPSLSPLGDFVVYSWDGGTGENDDIYLEQVESGKPLRRTKDAARDYSPCWSPDGSMIAFLRSAESGTSQIILMPPLSGEERVLASLDSPPPAWGPQLAWSPVGNWLVTSAKKDDQDTFGLYAIEVPSGEGHFVTDPPGESRGDYSPAFSPEGEFIAFIRSLGHKICDLFVVQAREVSETWPEPVRISSLESDISAPTWTASGKKIVFSAGSWPKGKLWRIDPLPGATPESLPLAGEGAYFPRINGRHRLVFTRYAVESNIWFLNLESKETTKAVFSSSGIDDLPEYSPCGSRVAFTSDRTGWTELWLSDQSGTRQLSDLKSFHTENVSWSPDGTRLAFDSTLAGNSDVWVLDVETGSLIHPPARIGSTELKQLTDHPAEDLFPSWSADGSSVYFCSKRTGSYEIWRAPFEGDQAVQITQNGGWLAEESPDGRFLYFTRWREPGIWRQSLPEGTVSRVTHQSAGRLAVAEGGIYFMAGESSLGHEFVLKHLDLATGEIKILHRGQKRLAGGWSVSKQAERVALAQYDLDGADLVLIDAFSCKKLVSGIPHFQTRLNVALRTY